MARGRTKKIDNINWTLSSGTFLAQGAGTVAAAFASAGTLPATLLRIRGESLCWVDAAQAPGGLANVSVGIRLAPEGQGTTVVNSPFTDGNYPWLFFETFNLAYEEMVIDVVDVPVITGRRAVIDNKAMRRVRPDQELQIVLENTTLGGAISVNYVYSLRTLQGY